MSLSQPDMRPPYALLLASAACGQPLASPVVAVVEPVELVATSDCLQPPVRPVAAYYVAQGFGQNNHLGEDWNGRGGGNTDLGDPVYTLAPGRVTYAAEAATGWGQVVRVEHRISTKKGELRLESVYAHLDTMNVARGDTIDVDAQIGTIGDAHGRYVAHLHLELREHPGLPLGPGYAKDTSGFADPRAFIAAHQADCPSD